MWRLLISFIPSSEFDIKGHKSVAVIEVAVVLHVPRFDFFGPFHLTSCLFSIAGVWQNQSEPL
jgi:hypothetical protein